MANTETSLAAQTQSAVCPLDCADTCSLEVGTNSDDQITSVRGNNDNPFTRGRLCAKVTNALGEQVQGTLRIKTPLRRTAQNRFEPISWDAALKLVHERFTNVIARWGAEAIAPLSYGGPMGLLANGSMDMRFFHRLGASKVDSSPLCAGTSSAAWDAVFGDAGGIDFEELAHSKLILIWGNNVTTCNLHLITVIRSAQKAGAKLVVIDPKRTRIARDADLHIPLLPGSDVALAYAVAALLENGNALDHAFIAEYVSGAEPFMQAARVFTPEHAAAVCGIEADLIHQFAELLATKRPAAMSIGVAPERNRNGGAGIRAALSLLALTGNIGPEGAGPCDVSRYFPVTKDKLSRPDLAPESLRELNVLDIPRYVLNPGSETPIKALFIYNHNPVAVHPQQQRMREALLSPEVFVVGSDLSMTDSMACADLILPATSHLEYGDLYTAYGHRYLQRSKPVIPGQGEGASNTELFRRLAVQFGFDEPCFGDSDETLMQQAFAPEHAHIPELAKTGAVDMTPYAEPAMLRGTAPSTPSGKIELFSNALEQSTGEGVPRYKPLPVAGDFILVTPASEQRVNSTFGGIEKQQADLRCEINPTDAAAHGVSQNDVLKLYNVQGAVELRAKVSTDIRPGTLYVPKGAWLDDSPTGATVNALIPGHQEGLIGGACYYDCTVSIARISG